MSVLSALRARRLGLLALLASLSSGCVVTTFEGPGEPPRVAPPPELPGGPPPGGDGSFGDSFAEAPARNNETIRARHLLVQYAGSKRASASLRRSRDEAYARATEALQRAKAGEDFAALVSEYSDEPGAAERGGDLGTFDRSSMVKAFSQAAFALELNAISEVVETEFGFHVIQRTE